MTDPKQLFREKYAKACKKAFEGFQLDLSKCKKPHIVLKIKEMAENGYYSKEIAESLNMTPKAVQNTYRRYNFPSLHNIEVPRLSERNDWKTGQKLMKGYIYQRVLDHPYGTKHGNYVALHRLVVEAKIGRYLLPSEVVDHIDGNIKNNSPENLRVFSSNSEHLSVTLKGKCPNWTPEGKMKISFAVSERHRRNREMKESSILNQ